MYLQRNELAQDSTGHALGYRAIDDGDGWNYYAEESCIEELHGAFRFVSVYRRIILETVTKE